MATVAPGLRVGRWHACEGPTGTWWCRRRRRRPGRGAEPWPARDGRSRCSNATPPPSPPTADEAFDWDRRGAPQVRHSHAFLARLRNLLRDHYPDVLEALLAAGATELRFGEHLPPTMVGFAPEPGDDDLVMLCVPAHDVRVGAAASGAGRGPGSTSAPASAVRGLLSAGRGATPAGRRPRDRRPARETASIMPAALTVVATGRRCDAARLAGDAGRTDDAGGGRRHRASSTSRASTGCTRRHRPPAPERPDRRRPRLPEVRRVRRRQPHVLGHAGRAGGRRRAPAAAGRARSRSTPPHDR